jgi:CDP-diacylglycerol--glycerol-3-phosphate 3-phosphatidyltransferase
MTDARLRRQWWLAAAGFVSTTSVVGVGLARAFDADAAGLWLLGTGVVVGYQLWFLRRSLGGNHAPEDDDPSASLGPANAVTLVRGWLYAGVAGFVLFAPPETSVWRWAPAAWYGVGALLDRVDGALARTVGRRTVLGARLDLAFDTVGFLVAPLVGVLWDHLPIWYLSISVARYLFKAGRGWRRARGKPVYDLPSSRVRRPLAALQMVFITVALVPVVPQSAVYTAAAVVVTPSLVVFLRDYLVVAGHLNARRTAGGRERREAADHPDGREPVSERS